MIASESIIQLKEYLNHYSKVIIIAYHRSYLDRERSGWDSNSDHRFVPTNK